MVIYDLLNKKIIATVAFDDEEISQFKCYWTEKTLEIFSSSNSQILRHHSLEFDKEIISEDTSSPVLINTSVKKSLRLIKYTTAHLLLDATSKFLILVDSVGIMKIILTSNFKTVRECKFGFGPLKVRLKGHYVFCLSKDRVLSVFDILKNKRHRHADLRKYKGIDTSFSNFIVLDDKFRYAFFINMLCCCIYI